MPAISVTSEDLDKIFRIESLNFFGIKDVLDQILKNLGELNNKHDMLDIKVNNLDIPDMSKLIIRLDKMDVKIFDCDKARRLLQDDCDGFKLQTRDNFEKMTADYIERDGSLLEKITKLEEDVELLKKRPMGGASVNLDNYVNIDDFNSLIERMIAQEKRNLEQDERLTNNEHRISKLEQLISDPMERIIALENRCDNLTFQLNNKVNVQDLHNELIKKADINDLKALEASLIRLNVLINDLVNQFADRLENDKAHKLLQKNLKNLYDLFMSLKGEGNEDDPMFTTKAL